MIKRNRLIKLFLSYPLIQSKNSIRLKIIEINEWENFIEAVITGKTEEGHSISFFDTNYFLHKTLYEVGEVYDFSVSALAYDIEILKENSFAFKGQEALDWLAKSGQEPTYDGKGNVEPVVFYLNELVAFLPTNKNYPDDIEFQSPIKRIENVKAFGKDFYKINITIFRDPDIEINLFAKTDFFNNTPKVNDAIRGIIWIQGKKE